MACSRREAGNITRIRAMLLGHLLSFGAALCLTTGGAGAAALREVSGFGSNPGNLRMFVYVPDGLPASRPLVVALHGCRQSAAAYDDETGWVKFADKWRFALLLPEQREVNNSRRCFNWFNGIHAYDWWFWAEWGSDIDRDQGEALSIRQMIAKAQTDLASDPRRLFVTGLSAGGGMTAVMLAVYPELFAGGAIIAGVPYKCALRVGEALASCGVSLSGPATPMRDLTPSDWAGRVFSATSHRGPWPRVSIWQGERDATVNPAAARELVDQWTGVHGIDDRADIEETVSGYVRRAYRDAAGRDLVESYTIAEFGHAVPIDPGPNDNQCGVAGDFVLPARVCSSFYIGRFWGLDRN